MEPGQPPIMTAPKEVNGVPFQMVPAPYKAVIWFVGNRPTENYSPIGTEYVMQDILGPFFFFLLPQTQGNMLGIRVYDDLEREKQLIPPLLVEALESG